MKIEVQTEAMSPPVNRAVNPVTPLSRRIGAMAALVPAALGVLVLGAWWQREWRLAAFEADRVPMAPITAILFVLLGLSLAARARWPDSRAARAASVVTPAAALVASALVALQSWRVLALPWDTWFLEAPTLVSAVPIGRMSPLTAAAFALAALAQLALTVPLAPRRALRLASTLAGGTGFSISALVMVSYASGAPLLYGGQTVPMALPTAASFVALFTAVLLVSDAHEILLGWRNRRTAPEVPEADAFGRHMVVAMCVLGGVIALSAFFTLRKEQASAHADIYRQLTTLVEAKAAQIREWRRERLADARFFLKDPALVGDFLALSARPADPTLRARCLEWLTLITDDDSYASVSVFDASGTLLLALPAVSDPAAHTPPQELAAALTGGNMELTDLHDHGGGSDRHMDLLVPIGPRHVSGKPHPPGDVAVGRVGLVLELNLRQTLLPLLQTWPTAGTTGEIMLLRREGNGVVLLNASRHAETGAALRKTVHSRPVTDLPSGQAELEPQAGLDYWGVPVLTAVRRVPGSLWILAAKIDQAEVDGILRSGAWRSLAPFGVLLLVLGLVGAFAWEGRQTTVLEAALSGERESKLASEQFIMEQKVTEQALRESKNLLQSVIEHVPTRIFWKGRDLRYLGANTPFATAAGYHNPDELTGKTDFEMAWKDQAELYRATDEAVMESGVPMLDYEQPGRTATGTDIWLSTSKVPLRGEQNRIIGVLGIDKDITERKRAEQEQLDSLREKEALLKESHHRVKNNLALIASLIRLEAGRSREPETKAKLQETQARIRSVVLLNETLYRTGSYATVQLADYLKQIGTHVFQAQNADMEAVRLVLDLEAVEVDTAQAIPCGLVLNELLTNSLKHAFNFGAHGEVRVLLRAEAGGRVRLVVSDTGSGLPEDFASRRGASLGLQLVSDLARQLLGHLDIVPPATFALTFSRGRPDDTKGIRSGVPTNA